MTKYKKGDELKYITGTYTITVLEVLIEDYRITVNSLPARPFIHEWNHDLVHERFRKLTKLDKALK